MTQLQLTFLPAEESQTDTCPGDDHLLHFHTEVEHVQA